MADISGLGRKPFDLRGYLQRFFEQFDHVENRNFPPGTEVQDRKIQIPVNRFYETVYEIVNVGEVTQAMSRAYIKELRDHINALQHQVKVLRVECEDLRKYNMELKAESFGNTWWKDRI